MTIAAGLLLVAATGLRVVQLTVLPMALHNDEMSCGLGARSFLTSEPPLLFGTGWFDCPNLQFFINSLFLRLFGDNLLGLRLGSVVLGLLSLAATYVLVRAIAPTRLALLLLALTVPFHWHLHLSRTGFHYVQAVAAASWSLALFALAVRRRSLLLAGVAGVVVGIALQSYYSAYLVPFLLVGWTAAWALFSRDERRVLSRTLAVTALLAAVTVAPLAANYVRHPEAFGSRSRGVFVLAPVNAEHVAGAVGSLRISEVFRFQVVRTLKLFFWGTDSSVQYGFERAFVDPFLRVPFLLGLLLALLRFRRPENLLALLWVGGTLMAGSMLTIDPPFSPRLSGMSTIMLYFPALALAEVGAWAWARRSTVLRATAAVVLVAVVAASWGANLWMYFGEYARIRPGERRDALTRLLAQERGIRTVVAAFDSPEEFGHEAYQFMAPGVRGINLADSKEPTERALAEALAIGEPVLVTAVADSDLASALSSLLPRARRGEVSTGAGERLTFWVVDSPSDLPRTLQDEIIVRTE